MSFYEELKSAAARSKLRLHTPGHKGGLSALDLTELIDDSFPTEGKLSAERTIAQAYRAKHATMLCGGSSQGVKAAIYYASANGIADVNSHRSVFDGFTLSGKTCSVVGRHGDIRPIEVSDIRAQLKPDIGVVIITSPTYYGYCADVEGIRDFCRANGLLFLIDGAHGAHFGGSKLLPDTFADKCDICNVSAHKTLSALTQSAIMLDNLDDGESQKLKAAADIMGTTSPSYLLYASIDYAVESLGKSAEHYEALYEPINELKARYPFLKNDDFTRLVLDCAPLGIGADALNAALCRRGVYGEMTDGRRIVFLFTAADAPQDISTLQSALDSAVTELK